MRTQTFAKQLNIKFTALYEITAPPHSLCEKTMDEFIKLVLSLPGNPWNMQYVSYNHNPDKFKPINDPKKEDIQIISVFDENNQLTYNEYVCLHYIPAKRVNHTFTHMEQIHVYSVKNRRSLYYKQLNYLFKRQYVHIRDDFLTKRPNLIHFKTVKTPRSAEWSSTGLFSIAYAISLMHGEDPISVDYDYDRPNDVVKDYAMRMHLIKIFKEKNLLLFPGIRNANTDIKKKRRQSIIPTSKQSSSKGKEKA